MAILNPSDPVQEFLDQQKANRPKSHPQEQIEEAIKTSKQTGKRVKLIFNKSEIEKEDIFQDLLNDPRTKNFSKDQVRLDVSPYEELTVGELGDLCLKAGLDCKLAVDKIRSLQYKGIPFPSDMSVSILKQDILELKAAGKGRGHTGKTTSLPPTKEEK